MPHQDGVDDFASRLMSTDRRKWQDPERIIGQAGLREGWTVADMACGPGYFTLPIAAKVGATGTVYAVDSSERMLEHLRANLEGAADGVRRVVRPVAADVCDTGIPAASVDFVFFANVLHDIPDHASLFREVRRISTAHALVLNVDWKKEDTGFGPPPEIRLSEDRARRIMEDGGLRPVGEIEAGEFHYGMLCERKRVLGKT
ncbi:MAG: class I SAM-dependent methyltransferase [Nitrososphaerota archaeon]|nr:class I SAM-dependent methyltransferase [Nitrososphaerota archaeon]